MKVTLRAVVIASIILLSLSNPALACEKCVQGNDNHAHCKDASVYTVAEGQLYAECTPIRWCYNLPDGTEECSSQCDGELCFIA